MNDKNPVPAMGEIESTNPCGEQPLLPYESCNLGSINLANHLTFDCETQTYTIDWEKLTITVNTAVRFLDDVIDVNRYPLNAIAEMTRGNRKIGLGVMGFADMLLYLGIPYNSDAGVDTAKMVMSHIQNAAWNASMDLGKKRGSFPNHNCSIFSGGHPRRNATVTTIAPTGTLSIIAGVSSGVEPVFAYTYIHNILNGANQLEVHHILEDTLKKRGIYSEELMHEIAEKGTLAHIAEIPDDIKEVFVCAHDISPEWHVKMQAAFQGFTDNAVSKTVNFPHSATKDEVAEVYRLAYKLGCKGTTIYRDGSRNEQVLNIGKVSTAVPKAANKPVGEAVKPRPRPSLVSGFTEKVKIGCGNLFITVNSDEQGVCEVFTNTGRTGGCPSQSEATARRASIAIRSGVDPHEIIEQLKGIRCPSCLRNDGVAVTSCPDAIAKALESIIKTAPSDGAIDVTPVTATNGVAMTPAGTLHAKFCPECGSSLEHEGGCVSCRNCGYSKCG